MHVEALVIRVSYSEPSLVQGWVSLRWKRETIVVQMQVTISKHCTTVYVCFRNKDGRIGEKSGGKVLKICKFGQSARFVHALSLDGCHSRNQQPLSQKAEEKRNNCNRSWNNELKCLGPG